MTTEDHPNNQGLTRREALRRGVMLGAGLVWVRPTVESVKMTSALAATTSPGPTDDTAPDLGNEGSGGSGDTPDAVDVGGIQVEPPPPEDPPPGDPPTGEPPPEVVVEDGELPFTGLPLNQVLPAAGGLIASGATAVHMAKNRKHGRDEEGRIPEDDGSSEPDDAA